MINYIDTSGIFNLWLPSGKAEDQKKVTSVTALLESLTALLEYLDLFSDIKSI